ncbi:hypothetical protein AACT_1477 [Arcobacter acticola]|uniref:Lipoprotein n=1 Tax=Arcobacter acticola TaxID=1849015 RepID=A0A6M8ENJ5_9BACT|nr:hypothetical protein [Arcobacter acticola]QKE28641.1 hypothetical protein AACT_1477 [Arcobacter acticola]
MKIVLNIFILALISVFISACSTKRLTIKSLHPSKIEKEKIYTIRVDRFYRDDVNQTISLEDRIENKVIDGKRIFKLQNTDFGTDAIVTGDVLNSSIRYDTYYRTEVDYSRCRYYRYDERNRSRHCMEYVIRQIPCENREYNVTTNINIIKPITNEVLFSKTYDKSSFENVCFDTPFPFYRTTANIFRMNSQIADKISQDIVDDISPHYVYYNINIIEELDDDNKLYTKEHETRFEKAVDLIVNKYLDLAKIELDLLDKELNGQSFEINYNLALIYEASNQLEMANKLYRNAKTLTLDIKYLDLIDYGINRTSINLEEKIKAKSQLP